MEGERPLLQRHLRSLQRGPPPHGAEVLAGPTPVEPGLRVENQDCVRALAPRTDWFAGRPALLLNPARAAASLGTSAPLQAARCPAGRHSSVRFFERARCSCVHPARFAMVRQIHNSLCILLSKRTGMGKISPRHSTDAFPACRFGKFSVQPSRRPK